MHYLGYLEMCPSKTVTEFVRYATKTISFDPSKHPAHSKILFLHTHPHIHIYPCTICKFCGWHKMCSGTRIRMAAGPTCTSFECSPKILKKLYLPVFRLQDEMWNASNDKMELWSFISGKLAKLYAPLFSLTWCIIEIGFSFRAKVYGAKFSMLGIIKLNAWCDDTRITFIQSIHGTQAEVRFGGWLE